MATNLREHYSTHTITQVASVNEISPDMFASMYESTAYQRCAISQFTIRSFQLFPEEKSRLVQLREAIFQYMVIKEGKKVEIGITSYLHAVLYTGDKFEQSKVVYVDIMSLPADSKTLLRVLNTLHKSFIVELGFRWLIVVGDARHITVFDINMVVKCSGCYPSLVGTSCISTRRCYLRCMVRQGCYNWQKWQDTELKH